MRKKVNVLVNNPLSPAEPWSFDIDAVGVLFAKDLLCRIYLKGRIDGCPTDKKNPYPGRENS
jgi:hypothetical protein